MSSSPNRGKHTRRSQEGNRKQPHKPKQAPATLTKDSTAKDSTTEKSLPPICQPEAKQQTELFEEESGTSIKPSTGWEIPEPFRTILYVMGIGAGSRKGRLWFLLLLVLFLFSDALHQIVALLRLLEKLW